MISVNPPKTRKICEVLFWMSALISTILIGTIEDVEHINTYKIVAAIAVMVLGIMTYVIDETLKISILEK